MPKIQISARISPEARQILDKEVEKSGMNESQLIEQCIIAHSPLIREAEEAKWAVLERGYRANSAQTFSRTNSPPESDAVSVLNEAEDGEARAHQESPLSSSIGAPTAQAGSPGRGTGVNYRPRPSAPKAAQGGLKGGKK